MIVIKSTNKALLQNYLVNIWWLIALSIILVSCIIGIYQVRNSCEFTDFTKIIETKRQIPSYTLHINSHGSIETRSTTSWKFEYHSPKKKVSTWKEYFSDDLPSSDSNGPLMFLFSIISILSSVFVLINISSIINRLYFAKTICFIDKANLTMEQRLFHFVNKLVIENIKFDKIIGYEVYQKWWNRLNNTAQYIKFEVVTYTNLDHELEDWYIYAVENPFQIVDLIIEHEVAAIKNACDVGGVGT